MPNYYISEKALKDLENIWEYTDKQWSRQQANMSLRNNFLSNRVYYLRTLLKTKNTKNLKEKIVLQK